MNKRLLIIILSLLFIPGIAFAEPIHITQSAIEACFANPNTYNDEYKMEFRTERYVTAFYLTGGEYILDEDIDTHRARITTENTPLVLNMNNHKITSELPIYNNYYFGAPVGCSFEGCDITLNGPGEIVSNEQMSNSILMEYGDIKVDKVKMNKSVRANSQTDYDKLHINITNSEIGGRIELWNATADIKNTSINTLKAQENQCLTCDLTLDGVDMGYDDLSTNQSNGLYIDKSSSTDAHAPVVTISNSTIRAGRYSNVISANNNGIVLNIDHSNLISYNSYSLSLNGVDCNIRDSHIQLLGTTPDYDPAIMAKGYQTSVNNVEELFMTFVPEGYYYYGNTGFEQVTSGTTVYNYVNGSDIWIIKKNDNATADNVEYIKPKDNEVIINIDEYGFLFNSLTVNGVVLDESKYEIIDNNSYDNKTTIKIKNDYLKTLEVDSYDVLINYKNGNVVPTTLRVVDIIPEVKGEEIENPKTGIPSHAYLFIIAIIAISIIITINRKSYFKNI